MAIKLNISKNILFFIILANMFFLSVLALNALNIPIKINKAKYAVIKYSYLVPTLTIDLTTFDLRKITHNNAEYKPVIKI